jgi:hypothetical protein
VEKEDIPGNLRDKLYMRPVLIRFFLFCPMVKFFADRFIGGIPEEAGALGSTLR